MFDRWGLLVSLTQCCPSVDLPSISASPLSCGPQWASPGCRNHLHSQFRQLVRAAVKADLKSAGWFERNMAEGFSKVASGVSLVFFSPTYPQIPTESWSWWQASHTHTALPHLEFPGMCQCLAEGPCLRGRHTAVIKSLVEEWSSPNGTALWLQTFACRHLSWTGSDSIKAP